MNRYTVVLKPKDLYIDIEDKYSTFVTDRHVICCEPEYNGQKIFTIEKTDDFICVNDIQIPVYRVSNTNQMTTFLTIEANFQTIETELYWEDVRDIIETNEANKPKQKGQSRQTSSDDGDIGWMVAGGLMLF